jgi:hypothetical protein
MNTAVPEPGPMHELKLDAYYTKKQRIHLLMSADGIVIYASGRLVDVLQQAMDRNINQAIVDTGKTHLMISWSPRGASAPPTRSSTHGKT